MPVATLNRVRESLGMLSTLFDSLLDVTVLDAGHTRPSNQTFRLQELFEQLRKDFAAFHVGMGADRPGVYHAARGI